MQCECPGLSRSGFWCVRSLLPELHAVGFRSVVSTSFTRMIRYPQKASGFQGGSSAVNLKPFCLRRWRSRQNGCRAGGGGHRRRFPYVNPLEETCSRDTAGDA